MWEAAGGDREQGLHRKLSTLSLVWVAAEAVEAEPRQIFRFLVRSG